MKKSNKDTRGEFVDKEVLMWKDNAMLVYEAGGTPKTMEEILQELLDKEFMKQDEVDTVMNDTVNREVTIGKKTISFKLEFPKRPGIAPPAIRSNRTR